MKTLRPVLYYLMFFLSVGVSGYAYAFFISGANEQLVQKFMNYPLFAYAHVFGGATALLLGPIQFHEGFRKRFINLHRKIGGLYLVSVVVGGMGSLYLAVNAGGGLTGKLGFGIPGVFWIFASANAFRAIKRREIDSHRAWMIRSFAATFAAVTLRLELPIMILAGVPAGIAYPVVAWLCWVPNLIVAELLLRVGRRPVMESA